MNSDLKKGGEKNPLTVELYIVELSQRFSLEDRCILTKAIVDGF